MTGQREEGRQILNGDHVKIFEKRLTLVEEIEGEDRIAMVELLRKVKEECGEVIGCRFKAPKSYELTMWDDTGKTKIMDGLKIKNIIIALEMGINEIVLLICLHI